MRVSLTGSKISETDRSSEGIQIPCSLAQDRPGIMDQSTASVETAHWDGNAPPLGILGLPPRSLSACQCASATSRTSSSLPTNNSREPARRTASNQPSKATGRAALEGEVSGRRSDGAEAQGGL